MSRTFSVPRLNETTTKPSSTSRRSSMYIEPRVPRNPWMIRTGGASGVTSSNAAPRRIRLPRARWRRYDSPSAPPATSWPMMLRLPSQRRGASSAQRMIHDARRSEATSFTIVREPVRDEPAALLRVRMAGHRRGRVLDYPPLSTRSDHADPADHIRLDPVDQREFMAVEAPAQRARVTGRDPARRRSRIVRMAVRDLARTRHPGGILRRARTG